MVVAAPPTAAGPGEVVRVAGPGRVETAAAASAHGWDRADDVVLATAGNFPDALAAGALVAALDAPLLLTDRDVLSPAVDAEIDRLAPERVWLLGGPAAIGQQVEDALAGRAEVRRLQGDSRFSTGAAVVAAIEPSAQEVLVALGSAPDPNRAWPDALSAGAFSVLDDGPALALVNPGDIPAATSQLLQDLRDGDPSVTTARILGGAGAVGEAVAQQLDAAGFDVVRTARASRYGTSAAAATEVLQQVTGPMPLILASGANFPDGLAAAGLTSRLGGLLVLVPPTSLSDAPEVDTLLRSNVDRFSRLVIIGGTAAISDDVRNQVASILGFPVLPPQPGPGPSPAPGSDTFPPPNPQQVVPSLDTARAVSQEVTRDEGVTLEAVGADGTTYTLELPAGSVDLATTVTMTPVASLSGSPYDGAVHAVQLEPEGLHLPDAATLTIQPATPLPAGNVSGHAWRGTGEDFHRYPGTPDGVRVVFHLGHFSGYGAAQATAEQVAAIDARPPLDTEARYHQAVAKVLEDSRRAGGPSDINALVDVQIRAYDDLVRPALQAGQDSDVAAELAIPLYFAWVRNAALLGLDTPELAQRADEGLELALTALVNAYTRAHQRCLEHDLLAVLDMLSHLRSLSTLGAEDRVDAGLVDACARLELDLESTVFAGGDGREPGFGVHVHTANMEVEFVGIPMSLGGDGRFFGYEVVLPTFTSLSWTYPGCSVYAERPEFPDDIGSTFVVMDASLDLLATGSDGAVRPNLSMTLAPPYNIREYADVDCPPTGDHDPPPFTDGADDFQRVLMRSHGFDLDVPENAAAPIVLTDWTFPQSGDVIATTTITHEGQDNHCGQTGSCPSPIAGSFIWTLRHAPLAN